MRYTGAERVPVYQNEQVAGYVSFVELANFLCDEEDGGNLRAHKLNFDLGTAMMLIRDIKCRDHKRDFLKPVLTFALIVLTVALLYAKPIMRFVREVIRQLAPVEVVVPKKRVVVASKKEVEDLEFRNEPFENIMGLLAKWHDLEVIYEDDSIGRMRFGGSISKSQSLRETLWIMELTGGLRFRVEGRKVFVGR